MDSFERALYRTLLGWNPLTNALSWLVGLLGGMQTQPVSQVLLQSSITIRV